jgi:amidase
MSSFGASVRFPTQKELSHAASELSLNFTDTELNAIAESLHGTHISYDRLARLPDVTLPVEYPRCPGYRPDDQENQYNAWYYKCKIQGAPDGKLKSKKIAMKDNVAMAGVPMMNGSMVLEGYTPAFDAPVVTRILKEGGTIVGKTVCESLCFSGASYITDCGPTRNPYCPSRSAGGSSGGSAVVVRTGEADMAIGGDQGGSIRIPASSCGIVGLKPTWSLVPYTGACAIEPSIDHLGPMAGTVKDCALMLEVIAGYDQGSDGRQSCFMPAVPEYTKLLGEPVKTLRIGLLKEGFDVCEDRVAGLVRQAVDKIRGAGVFATVEEMSVPLHHEGIHIMAPILTEGIYDTMYRNAGCAPGTKGMASPALTDAVFRGITTNPDQMPPVLKKHLLWAQFIHRKHGAHFLAKSRAWIEQLRAAYDAVMDPKSKATAWDVLVMPTLPIVPCKIPTTDKTQHLEYINNAMAMCTNTAPFNATGHPAISVPAGFALPPAGNQPAEATDRDDKLPVGVMIVGRHFEDATVLRVAQAFEDVLGLLPAPAASG